MMNDNTKGAAVVPILSVPLTHADWLLRLDMPCGPESVHYMLDQCKASGWKRIYWRAFDGGRAVYQSKWADPATPVWDDDNYWSPRNEADYAHAYWIRDPAFDHGKMLRNLARLDYSHWDSLSEAVRYGHSIGLEVHAWLTINEDDHAWGLQSRFSKENPQSRWRRRDGSFYHSQQSFAFPEVREYKLKLVRELLEGYDIDGLFLDWMRTGDVRDDPQNDEEGVANYGYEEPLIRSFQDNYGIDPRQVPNGDDRWVGWRAEPQTAFMREVRRLMRSLKPHLPLAVMAQHPWSFRGDQHKIDGNLRGLLLDTASWAREGLVDAMVPAGYYRDGGDAEKAFRWLKEEIGPDTEAWTYAWVPSTPAEFDATMDIARKVNAPQILFWEADYIDAYENKLELQRHMSATTHSH